VQVPDTLLQVTAVRMHMGLATAKLQVVTEAVHQDMVVVLMVDIVQLATNESYCDEFGRGIFLTLLKQFFPTF